MNTQILFNTDEKKLNLQAINSFFSSIRNINSEKIFIAVSGGRSLLSFYENILNEFEQLEEKYWKKIIFCFADERLVPLENKDSSFKLINEKFFSKLLDKKIIRKDQIISIKNFEKDSINSSKSLIVLDYNSKIEKVDICLIGVGEDSHIASLFPNHKSVYNEEKKYILVEDSPKEPPIRISMSKKMIANCSYVFIFFIGNEKLKAYKMFQDEKLNINECPSKIVLKARNTYIISDLK